MVGYLTNNSNKLLHESLLFKGKFDIKFGKPSTGFSDGVMILTPQRKMIFRAGSDFKRDEWVNSLREAYSNSEWNHEKINSYVSSFPMR